MIHRTFSHFNKGVIDTIAPLFVFQGDSGSNTYFLILSIIIYKRNSIIP